MRIKTRFLLPLLLAAVFTADGFSTVHHNMSETDKFTECLRLVYGTPVLWWPALCKVVPHIACPADPNSLADAFVSNHVKVDFIYLFDADSFPPWKPDVLEVNKMRWTHVSARVNVQNDASSSTQLTEPELLEVRREVLSKARTFEIFAPYAPDMAEAAAIPLEIRTLTGAKKTGVRFTAALYSQGNDYEWGRLVFGIWQAGKYIVERDSPIVPAFGAQVSLQDVDADGTDEIVLESEVGVV